MRITESQLRRIVRDEILREQGERSPASQNVQRAEAAFDKSSLTNALKGVLKGIKTPQQIADALHIFLREIQEASGDAVTPSEMSAIISKFKQGAV